MENYTKKYFVLKNRNNNKYFSIDSNSGGYPSFVDDPIFAEKFKKLEDLKDFLNSKYCQRQFRREIKECAIVSIDIVEDLISIECLN